MLTIEPPLGVFRRQKAAITVAAGADAGL